MYSYIKKTFYEDDNLKVVLEEADGHLMAHLTLYNTKPSSLKLAQRIWEEIKARAFWMGYEEIYTYTKENRMLKLFPGGTVIGDTEHNGERLAVIKWELK